MGAGRSDPEIAAELFISLATMKSHVRHILAKLDLRDRAQAIGLAHECGLASRGRAVTAGLRVAASRVRLFI